MEIKIVKKLDNLPHVFLDQFLNKFSTSKNFVDCGGKKGCLQINNEVKEVRGIYYTPAKPILKIETRRKNVKGANDVMNLLRAVDFKMTLQNMGITTNTNKFLVSWDNYSISIFDIYFKGRIYEFPIIAQQNQLRIYQVPEPKDVFCIFYSITKELKQINMSLFEELNEFMIYNHKVIFNNPIFEYKELYTTPGAGSLIYAEKQTTIKLESSDSKDVEFTVQGNTWLLFSHPRPKKSSQD